MRFSVVMACHNRRDLTVTSIKAAQNSADYAGVEISFVVFDDGSIDGTSESIADLELSTELIRGDGNTYWAKSMSIAENAILGKSAESDDGFIVWLNDDVVLDVDSFEVVCREISKNVDAVIVGAMREPSTGEISYSGMDWKGPHPLNFDQVAPNPNDTQIIDTFNGNFVIVPMSIARRVGGIDGRYSHALADIDYGLRCKKLNIPVVLASRSLGACPRNKNIRDSRVWDDWKRHVGVKGGGNYKSLKIILKKNNPKNWMLIILGSYTLWWVRRCMKIMLPRRATS